MSVRLMSVVWEITWPTQSHLLVMLKMADYANDDGGKVWPAVATIAKQAQCSERTVQNVLKALRNCGLVNTIKEGGGSMPTIYQLNVPLLRSLSGRALEGNFETIEIPDDCYPQTEAQTGATVAPPDFAPVQMATGRGANGDMTGANTLHPNHHLEPSREPPCARTRAKGENFISGSEGVVLAAVTVTNSDPQWKSWIEHLRQTDPPKADQAERSGELTATARWPDKGRLLSVKGHGLTERSKAILGEGAA